MNAEQVNGQSPGDTVAIVTGANRESRLALPPRLVAEGANVYRPLIQLDLEAVLKIRPSLEAGVPRLFHGAGQFAGVATSIPAPRP
ncbi:hypothetical protein [Arthrobacter sp. W4I7]|uniref:hypothetical protein n=1 Tax=Arthrobacter sp. W4I7 TaxID=3042296 RepID=UPI0027857AFB|nr:hypothetical protein [Arthrobacter sp. W4I7]MDQ0691388.1 hypothetical protein [Arthrobacter sp. W4I7]